MGLRESLNKNPAITTGITIAIVVLAIGIIIWQVTGVGSGPSIPTSAFYTVDDGKTTFEDDINKLAPFDYKGKEAVRANMFRCGGDAPFVGYLERYTPEGKKMVEQARKNPSDLSMGETLSMTAIEVKKPGAGDWVKQTAGDKYYQIVSPKCPSGKEIEPVLP